MLTSPRSALRKHNHRRYLLYLSRDPLNTPSICLPHPCLCSPLTSSPIPYTVSQKNLATPTKIWQYVTCSHRYPYSLSATTRRRLLLVTASLSIRQDARIVVSSLQHRNQIQRCCAVSGGQEVDFLCWPEWCQLCLSGELIYGKRSRFFLMLSSLCLCERRLVGLCEGVIGPRSISSIISNAFGSRVRGLWMPSPFMSPATSVTHFKADFATLPYSIFSTISPIAKLAVRPGLSIPSKLMNPVSSSSFLM